MNFLSLITNVLCFIKDEKSFDDKIASNLFVLVFYKKCVEKCDELKTAIEYQSQHYYYVDVAEDKEAAVYMNKIGVMEASAYPIVFFESTIIPDPFNSPYLDEKLRIDGDGPSSRSKPPADGNNNSRSQNPCPSPFGIGCGSNQKDGSRRPVTFRSGPYRGGYTMGPYRGGYTMGPYKGGYTRGGYRGGPYKGGYTMGPYKGGPYRGGNGSPQDGPRIIKYSTKRNTRTVRSS